MGDHEGWAQPSGPLPNGLLGNEAGSVTRVLDTERWLKAEERTAELIECIQPNQPSEERRNAVADYVQRLIMKCFSCQVFTFGSVPLKTYLPDGDIDLTAFSKNQSSKDTWANEVRDMLENEEKSENAEFRVKEVQYIQAEVKIIKCLVENIVVDISFNQLGGLCTLCFLDEVDHLINQSHLFKRSIILIKAWCYYESRILGAHHGLISTYALETLVLYIFHVFNNSFTGPLEVLYRFLEFFSNFDWDNFCVSLWGPVPISSLPDITAEPPRRDSGELLLNKTFLDACSLVYAVFPGGHENQGQPFASKHFNVIDPLRTNNNLGRSVSKGNFFRIRSAFAFGAKKLARLLECPKECVVAEINQFFMNTWDRHGSGNRPDAPCSDLWPLRPNFEPIDGSDNFKKHLTNKTKAENDGHESHTAGLSRTANVSSASRSSSQKNFANQTSSRNLVQISKSHNSSEVGNSDKVLKNLKPSFSTSEREAHGRYHFARTRSSPELTDIAGDAMFRGRRNKMPDTGKSQSVSVRPEHTSRRRNTSSEISGSHSVRSSGDDPSSLRHSSSNQTLDATVDSNSASNSYQKDIDLNAVGEDLASVSETMEMHQEDQDLVNMMASTRFHNFGGKIQLPMNFASAHLPFPISPSVLTSMGYAAPRGMVPANFPLIDPAWGSGVQFPQGMVSSPLSNYFPGVGLGSNQEDMIDFGNENPGLSDLSQEDGDNGFWQDHDAGSTSGLDSESGSYHIAQSDNQLQSNLGGFGFVPSQAANSSGSSMRGQHKFIRENRNQTRDDYGDNFQYQNSRGRDAYSDKNVNLIFLPVAQASSSRTKTGSDTSWDGSAAKVNKSARDKRGRKASNVYGKAKTGWQYEAAASDHGSAMIDEVDNRDWIPLSTVGSEMEERSLGPKSVGPSNIRSHQLPGYESAQLPGLDSMVPISPMFLGPGSRQRTMDGSGAVPFAFYPTGPPVPFLTMLPFYNFPVDTGNSDASEDGLDTGHGNHSDQNFDSAENRDHSEVFSSSNSIKSPVAEPHEEHKPDILNSDFARHWQNLQYGRFCQNPRYSGPLNYPSPVMVPPVYLQGHFPWDGPGRPLSANVNLVTQLMNYGPRFVPVVPIQPSNNRPGSVYQRYGEEVPRYRGGTGTYLPNPKSVPFRDRQSSNTRNHRGNYNYDGNDHGDREGNWNVNSKARGTGRNHGYSQAEKPSSRPDRLAPPNGQPDRLWDSYRPEPFGLSQAQNGPYSSANSMHGSANMAYGMYPPPTVNSNGSAPTGSAVASMLMPYPYDHHVGYDPTGDQLNFGSLNEVPQRTDGGSIMGVYEQRHSTYQGGSPARSSPDQPSSPHIQRSAAQRNYQLKDEDFPPLWG